MFWVNIPLGIVATVMLLIALKENVRKRQHRIDYIGAALMAAATSLLMFALVHAETLSGLEMFGAFIACALLFGALFVYERLTPEPMLPFKLYRNRFIAGGNSIGLTTGAIMMSIVAFLPAYMQGVMGLSSLVAGVALGAMSAAWPFGGFVGSRLLLWIPYRIAATIGAVILVTGSLLMIALHIGATAAQPVAAALLMGFGMGITNICFVVAIQANVAWSERGAATSSIVFSRIIGQSFGSAVFGGILNFGMAGHGGGSDTIVGILRTAGRQGTDAASIQSLLQALTNSLHNIYLVSGLLAIAVLATVLTLPSHLKLIDRR